jgi:hypothetical protein
VVSAGRRFRPSFRARDAGHPHPGHQSAVAARRIGAAIIIVPQLFLPILLPNQGCRDFVDALASLVYYR